MQILSVGLLNKHCNCNLLLQRPLQ